MKNEMSVWDTLRSPVITEKSVLLKESTSEEGDAQILTFRVVKGAGKEEIKKAVEEFYGVTVINVNTTVVPGKNKTRYTKAGFVKGQKPAYKKALVTVAEGETIDLYGNI